LPAQRLTAGTARVWWSPCTGSIIKPGFATKDLPMKQQTGQKELADRLSTPDGGKQREGPTPGEAERLP